MSFYLLPNTVGNIATSIDTAGSGAGATGFDIKDLISGPRCRMFRAQTSVGAIRAGYHVAADTTVTHMVIARADLLVTQNGTRVRPLQKDAGGSWTTISGGADYNPLTTADLMGPTSRDLAFAISPVDLRGFGITTQAMSGSQAIQLSKLYVSNGFSFGKEPQLRPAPSWNSIPRTATVELSTPMKGTRTYAVTDSISIRWTGITTAKSAEFKALPQLLNWPMFLYDSSGAVFKWKLEHVIVQSWQEDFVDEEFRNISITFLRLADE